MPSLTLRVRPGVIVRATMVLSCVTGATLVAWQTPPRPDPQPAHLSAPALAEVTALLKREVADQRIAGAVAAIARRGHVGYLEAVGVQDLDTRQPMSTRSLFRIYSMTKPITAAAVMMLVEERRAGLDDAVAKYLPGFADIKVLDESGGAPRRPSRAITVRDLLLHTSGLSHRTSEIYRREQVRSRTITMSAFVANLVRVGLMEDPGTRYRYSEGTTVLGRLVEIWSGKPFDVFLDERIFRPLQMRDTAFAATTPDERARLTTVYGPGPTAGLARVETETLPFTERPAVLEGAVGLLSTVPDYLRFSQMLLNKGELDGVRLLSAATVDTMTKNGLTDAVQRARGGSMGWGLANVDVALQATATSNAGEYGWDGTAGTIFWIDPSTDTITILMTQSSPANPGQIRQRFKTLVRQALVD
jgi:CubicO group peptidase (beta-lactamase class C family)